MFEPIILLPPAQIGITFKKVSPERRKTGAGSEPGNIVSSLKRQFPASSVAAGIAARVLERCRLPAWTARLAAVPRAFFDGFGRDAGVWRRHTGKGRWVFGTPRRGQRQG